MSIHDFYLFFIIGQSYEKDLVNLQYLLVKGKLTVILDRKPGGGCLTKGIDSDGVIAMVVPGGRARRPSFVIHKILFCLEWGIFSLANRSWTFGEAIGSKAANAMLSNIRGTGSIANL